MPVIMYYSVIHRCRNRYMINDYHRAMRMKDNAVCKRKKRRISKTHAKSKTHF